MKKLLALVLALVMTMGLATAGTNAAFKDQALVDKSDYAEAITVMNGMKVFEGDQDGNFNPNDPIDRASTAAMIYRLYTGDTGKTNYVRYANDKFSDVTSDKWYAGYIGFCENAEFIYGAGDGKFYPDNNVTGYQALAMVLRAIGMNKEKDFTGSDWELTTARIAADLGLVRNVSAEVLKQPASRALVAEILFEAAQKPTYSYTPAFRYRNYVNDGLGTNVLTYNESLGWKNFKLTKSGFTAATQDDWGRPAYVWYAEKSGLTEWTGTTKTAQVFGNDEGSSAVYAKFAADYNKAYGTAVAQCDIAHDVGQTSVENYEVYLNGTRLDMDPTTVAYALSVNPTATGSYVGATGRTTEVYYDYDGDGANRIVMIDNYLARVTSVSARGYDKNEHLNAPATLNLEIFNSTKTAPEKDIDASLIKTDADWTYSAGDYLLVNISTNVAPATANAATALLTGHDDTISYKAASASTFQKANVPNKSFIVGAPKTLEAAQTRIHINDGKHEVNGTVYDDSLEFHLDYVGIANGARSTERALWFFDQYENVIGNVELDRNSWAVLENMWWVTGSNGSTGHAEAVLRYFDGTTETKTVTSLDGVTLNTAATPDATTPVGAWLAGANNHNHVPMIGDLTLTANIRDAFVGRTGRALVSEDNALNAIYHGLALYRVRSQDSGSVILDGWVDDGTTGTAGDNNRNANTYGAGETLVQHAGPNQTNASTGTAGVTVQVATGTNTSAILGNDGNPITFLNSDTKFIYRTATATGFEYTPYTGAANVPAMVADSAEVFYVANSNNVATLVYVRNYTPAGLTGTHFFLNSKTAWRPAANGDYIVTAIIDGVERENFVIPNALWADIDARKLYHATINAAGVLQSVALVNEATDSDTIAAAANGHATTVNACDYLYHPVRLDGDTLLINPGDGTTQAGGTIGAVGANGTIGYSLTNANFYGAIGSLTAMKGLTAAQLNTYGIWLVFDGRAGSTYRQVSAVYSSSSKLSNAFGFTVTPYANASAAAAGTTPNGTATTVTSVVGTTPNHAVNVAVALKIGETNVAPNYVLDAEATFNGATTSAKDATRGAPSVSDPSTANTGVSKANRVVTSVAQNNTIVSTGNETLTVLAEDGFNYGVYTVTFTATAAVAGELTDVLVDGSSVTDDLNYDTTLGNFPVTTLTYQIPAKDRAFNIVLNSITSSAASVKAVQVTSIDTPANVIAKLNAAADLTLPATITVNEATAKSGGFVVFEIVGNDGTKNYTVMQITAATATNVTSEGVGLAVTNNATDAGITVSTSIPAETVAGSMNRVVGKNSIAIITIKNTDKVAHELNITETGTTNSPSGTTTGGDSVTIDGNDFTVNAGATVTVTITVANGASYTIAENDLAGNTADNVLVWLDMTDAQLAAAQIDTMHINAAGNTSSGELASSASTVVAGAIVATGAGVASGDATAAAGLKLHIVPLSGATEDYVYTLYINGVATSITGTVQTAVTTAIDLTIPANTLTQNCVIPVTYTAPSGT